MKNLMMLALSFFGLTAAEAQEPPSEPAVEELSRLLLQQKEIIDAQAKELEFCESTSFWSISRGPGRTRTARAAFPTRSKSGARFDSDSVPL